jgi:molybdate transport system substrate-binding protein
MRVERLRGSAMRGLVLSVLLFVGVAAAAAESTSLHLAVASNFADAMRKLAAEYEATSGHQVVLSFGSTGKLYAQIVNGAPFDAFFAADVERPRLLEEAGLGLAGSRFTYAIGRVVLWSPEPGLVDDQGRVLRDDAFRHLALANPELAPYGVAARAVLQQMGVWEAVQGRLVMGQNIAQTYQFVDSGNAELGFVAYAQLRRGGERIAGSYWLPAPSSYPAIEQQAVVLRAGEAVEAFMAFVRSPDAVRVMRDFGYEVSDAE